MRRKLLRRLSVSLLAFLSCLVTFAQNKSIQGQVRDSQGPLPGVTVLIEGTTNGTITDFDGNFSIMAPAKASLKFSFIGYEDQVLPAVNGMTVTLVDASEQLGEIEVVAYGAQKKVTVTGAISSVKAEDLLRTPVSSVNNVLAGQLSGVTTVQYSGEPGSDAADIFVRGKGTFNSDGQSPLIQVDGVERDMYDIDPSEIESVTVLKDASATAVFGVRGANGVILVTTKRGKEGKSNISVSTSFSALSPTKMVEMAGSYDYALFHNQMRKNDDQAPLFSDLVIEKFRTGEDPVRFPSIDWADYIMKDYSLQTQHNLSIDGGNDKVKYFVSAGAFTQSGLFKMFDLPFDSDYRYKRFNYRTNLDIDVTKFTTISVNVSGKLDRTIKPNTGQGSSGMIKNIYGTTPFVSAGFVDGKLIYTTTNSADNQEFDKDGTQAVLPFTGSADPFNYLRTGGFYRQDNTKMSVDLIFNQKLDMLTKGLSFRVKGSYNSSYYVQKAVSGGSVATYNPVYQPDGSIKLRKLSEDKTPASYKNTLGKGRDWYFEAAFDYNRSFDLHNVKALVLYNQSKQYYYSSQYSSIPRTYVGLVARVSYDWNNRYMGEFNFGYNGSENFAPENRFGKFPAGSVGWAVSEEPFFENAKWLVSFLKLRASWGLVGNDKIAGSRFMYIADPWMANDNSDDSSGHGNVDHGGSAYYFGAADTYGVNAMYPGAYESSKNNANVSWEKAFKQDYGVDINFLENEINCSFDYYMEHRRDILVTDGTAPGLLGYKVYPYANLGEVDSWGWEASVGYNKTLNDNWRVWAKFNISYNQNEIVVDKQAIQNEEYMYTKGRRIGSRSQLLFWGLYDKDSAAKYKAQFGQDLPTQSYVQKLKYGDAIYVDLNGDGVVDDNDYSRDFGHTDDPEYIAGLTLGFAWKNLSFNAQFTGAWNVTRQISDVFRKPFSDAAGTNQGGLLVYHLDNTWSEANPDPSAKYPRATTVNATQNYANSTLYEQDSKYLRLKTAEISYNFNFPFMKTIGMKRLQLALNGYNLFTITPYLWGDPETRASNAPSYPLQRTYTASLKMAF